MSEINGFDLKRFEELGYTVEEARNKAVEILESVNFNRELLKRYTKPIEELPCTILDIIESIIMMEDDVRDFATYFEDGLSKGHHAASLEMYLLD